MQVARQAMDSTYVTIQDTPDSTSRSREGVVVTAAEDHRSWWSLVHVEHISNASLWLKIGKMVLRNLFFGALSLGL